MTGAPEGGTKRHSNSFSVANAHPHLVARHACRDEIEPSVAPALADREHVVQGQLYAAAPTTPDQV